jgi:hypothetical protein
MLRYSVREILAEWAMADSGSDRNRWLDSLARYESGALIGRDQIDEAAELMCAGLTHFVAGEPVPADWAGESPETTLARTIWHVLAVCLRDGGAGLSASSARRLRLALAAIRQCGYQARDLGGDGFLEGFFDSRNRELMASVLTNGPGMSGPVTAADLDAWFSGSEPSDPSEPSDSPSGRKTSAATAAAWLVNSARQAQQHVNPVLLQQGVEAVQDALIESKVAKVDRKTGKLKVRKLGVAKAALRPGQTVRKAIDGAAVGERLKSYNEIVGALPPPVSPEEFASYPSKRDFLRDWARRLVVAADVAPSGQLIDSYANAAARDICSHVFIPFGAARGISDIGSGASQETFDVLYLKAAPTPAQRRDADQQITAFLNSVRDQWVKHIRQQHG